ncbi:SDR family oxidoreductase [Seongchinamella unica]|uniref:SDR family oxidoreductase n=1 Tax=Seongchinamella unica TaxID=2547392 RepID=A0A4R5LTZ6_9GAMM|nr:SDR family oxidoreductase [Seongchinamella unica]TDG14849.1 SDR family oxidoreductase [Seongchinamella unica]
MGTLTGKTAVVVGASGESNFGTAIARRLAQEGANVVVSARRKEPLAALAGEIGGLAVACDVTDEAQQEALFAAAREKYGQVDIAVFSAGIHAADAIAELSADKILPSLQVSFVGALLFFKHAANAMEEGGSVITISSLTARIPGPGLAVYSGARAGIDYAIKVAAQEYGPRGIRFNSIAAGLIETDMTSMLFGMDPVIEAYIDATPVGRMGNLDDMAEAALFLADGQRSSFINAQVLDLAGGQQNGHLPRF